MNGAAPVPPAQLCALNVALEPAEDGTPPDWVELIPPGREVKGRDGRAWVNDRPDAIVDAFNSNGGPIPIGIGHAIETAGPEHAPPAVAWIEALEAREGGAIWGRVSWNSVGRQALGDRAYRYLSPAFLFEKESRRIAQLLAAGLVNLPNLRLAALNHRQGEHEPMTWEQVLEALKLPKDATPEQALNAVQTLQGDLQTAVNARTTPPLDRFVPRADYDAAVNARETAETRLSELVQAEQAREVEAEISKAIEAKKITPATADYYRAMCALEGGLAQFQAFIAKAPTLAPDAMLQGDPTQQNGAKLTPDELAVCQRMGLSEDAFLAAKG